MKYPYSLLYHQTMSTLASVGELSPAALAQRVLTLAPFQMISQDDYKNFLLHLLKINHVQQTDERGLIVGLGGEPVVRNFRFYAVFPDNDEYSVKADSKEIGSISAPPPPGERFALAGRAWEVSDIDLKRKVVYAKLVKGKVRGSWYGKMPGQIHTRILQRMRKTLLEDTEYPYLLSGAKACLKDARRLARRAGLDTQTIVALGDNLFCVFPWMGLRAYLTLERCLKYLCKDSLQLTEIWPHRPYFLTVKQKDGNLSKFRQEVASLHVKPFEAEDLVGAADLPMLRQLEKFNEFVPDDLLLKSFANDWLDVDEMKILLRGWS